MSFNIPDKKVLFSAADGPEGIEIYTSEERAIVDYVGDYPAMYISAAIEGASVLLGPFMKSVRIEAEQRLQPNIHEKIERAIAEIERLQSMARVFGVHENWNKQGVSDSCSKILNLLKGVETNK